MAATQNAEAGQQVVVGIDGSPSSLGALEWAARQADITGATLLVVAVWDWPRSYGGLVLMPDNSVYDPAADAQRLLDQAVSEIQQTHNTLTVTTRVVQGHPALVLVEASSGAGVLAVGSRGHGEFVGMLLGSVSEYCVSHAHCPVLVYHQPAHPR
jgi:nucleotide-binding universal stress UspA family protein